MRPLAMRMIMGFRMSDLPRLVIIALLCLVMLFMIAMAVRMGSEVLF